MTGIGSSTPAAGSARTPPTRPTQKQVDISRLANSIAGNIKASDKSIPAITAELTRGNANIKACLNAPPRLTGESRVAAKKLWVNTILAECGVTKELTSTGNTITGLIEHMAPLISESLNPALNVPKTDAQTSRVALSASRAHVVGGGGGSAAYVSTAPLKGFDDLLTRLNEIDRDRSIEGRSKPKLKEQVLDTFLKMEKDAAKVYRLLSEAQTREGRANPKSQLFRGVGHWLGDLKARIDAAAPAAMDRTRAAAGGSPAQAVLSDHGVMDFSQNNFPYDKFNSRRDGFGFIIKTDFAQDVAFEASRAGGQPIIVIAGNPDRPGGATTDVDRGNAFRPIVKGGQEESMVMNNFAAAGSPKLQQALVHAYTTSRVEIVADQRRAGATCPAHYRSAVVLKGEFAFQTSKGDNVQAGIVSVSGPNIAKPTGRRMDNHYDNRADYQGPGLNAAQRGSAKQTFMDSLKQSYTSALEAALWVHGHSHTPLTVVLPLLSSGIYGGRDKDESSRISNQALQEVLATRDQKGVALGQYFDSVIVAKI